MTAKLSRRFFLRNAFALGAVGSGVLAYKGAQETFDLLEQHETWVEASRPNSEFFSRHASDLQRLNLGGTFAPEQWSLLEDGQAEALKGLDLAVRDLGMSQMRLGLRWSRSVDSEGRINLSAYRAYLDYCLAHDVDVCLNVGPIRTFRWPEEHVHAAVLERLQTLPGEHITAADDLAIAAYDYLDRLLATLRQEYGEALTGVKLVQIENEPFYRLGKHQWRFSQDYLAGVAQRVDAAVPHAKILVTSAGRLNLDDVRDLFVSLTRLDASFEGRLVSGFDFHYKTPRRDSVPVVRHFDQISYAGPFKPTLGGHIEDSRRSGFRIEVTEAQAEPYGQFTSPGNSARDLRFLILRLLDKALDPDAPALIRLWGVEELSKRLLRGEATTEHRQMVEIVRAVNGMQAGQPSVQAP